MVASKEPVERLTVAVTTLASILQRAHRHEADPIRVGLLQTVDQRGAIRPSEVASELGVSASSVTRHAQALEAGGLVKLAGDVSDGRACLISVTDEGRAEIARLHRGGVDYFRGELSDWSKQDVRTLAELVERLCDTLVAGHQRRQAARKASWRTTS